MIGPESIALDITLNGFPHVYGIPVSDNTQRSQLLFV